MLFYCWADGGPALKQHWSSRRVFSENVSPIYTGVYSTIWYQDIHKETGGFTLTPTVKTMSSILYIYINDTLSWSVAHWRMLSIGCIFISQ